MRSVVIFLCIFCALYFGGRLAGEVIAGGLAGGWGMADAENMKLANEASRTFERVYTPYLFAAAVILSALLAFGLQRLTYIYSIPLALIGFVVLHQSAPAPEEVSEAPNPTPEPVVAGRPTPRPITVIAPAGPVAARPGAQPAARAHRTAILLTPVTVAVPYGKTVVRQGTVVTVLSEGNGIAQVQAPDGARFSIPLNQIK